MTLGLDLKYATRQLLKRPGFTALTILVMALGIGLTTYTYALINALFFAPLPYEEGDRIVAISAVEGGQLQPGDTIPLNDIAEIRQRATTLHEFGVFEARDVTVRARAGARRYSAAFAEPGIFNFTRTDPLRGRGFDSRDAQPGATRIAVVSYRLWQDYLDGSEPVVGQSIEIDGTPTEIVGVMPEGYHFPRVADIWLPLRQSAENTPRGEGLTVAGYARMKPGSDLSAVNRELSSIMSDLAQRFPKTNGELSALADSFPMIYGGRDSLPLIISLFAVVGLLLLLTCINVGTLLLSRAAARGKETAIRAALGASRPRLLAQSVWDGAIICLAAGLFGFLLAGWFMDVTGPLVLQFTAGPAPFWWDLTLDRSALAVTVLIVVLGIATTGALPGWQSTRLDINGMLRAGSTGRHGRMSRYLGNSLVISEIFISSAILILAGIAVVSTYNAVNADYGARTNDAITARVLLTDTRYESEARRQQFVTRLHRELKREPAVKGVGVMSSLPGDSAATMHVGIRGRHDGTYDALPSANVVGAVAGSLNAAGIRLIDGRYFRPGESAEGRRVVIVTEGFAKRHFSGLDAVGSQIRVGGEPESSYWADVVGIVGDTIHGAPFSSQGSLPTVYVPPEQYAGWRRPQLVLYHNQKREGVAALRQTLGRLDASVPASDVQAYEALLRRNTAGIGLASRIFLVAGILAFLLAGSGIYGVMGNAVIQQTQEIGVRRAFGATDGSIRLLFFRWAALQALAGLGLGVSIAVFVGSSAATLLGAGANVLTSLMAGVPLAVALLVALGVHLPVTRVLQREPNAALREE